MHILTEILLWLHFVGLAIGTGSGVAMSRVGPQLIAASPAQREQLWPLALFLSRLGLIGLIVLLFTGPVMMWLKFGGVSAMNAWFWAKMALVLVAVVSITLHKRGLARFREGDEAVARSMSFAGRLTGMTMLLVFLCAVFAFN